MSEQSQSAAQRLIGSWRYLGSTLDGKPQAERGAQPEGHHHVRRPWPHGLPRRARSRRERAGKKPTGEEAKAALEGHIAYFGTYSVDERARTVTHHREGSVQPGDKGDVVRGYEFAGDRLILRPVGTTREVIWERIK